MCGEQHEIFSRKGKPQNLYAASEDAKPPGEAVEDPAVDKLDDEFKAAMTEYKKMVNEMTGAASDRKLMTEANKLRRRAKALLKKIVVLVKAEIDKTRGGPESTRRTLVMSRRTGSNCRGFDHRTRRRRSSRCAWNRSTRFRVN